MRIAFLLLAIACNFTPLRAAPPLKSFDERQGDRVVIIGNPAWPQGGRLPKWFVVTATQAKLWGYAGLEDERATVRVTFENRSDQEINVLNLNFLDARFVVVAPDGKRRNIPVKLEDGDYPRITPQTILGPRSRVSFDVQFRHPSKKTLGADASFRSQATMCFLLRDYLERGKRQSFNYSVPIDVLDDPKAFK